MATIVNDRDIILQATSPRLEVNSQQQIIFSTNANTFVKLSGGIQPSSITIKPILTGRLGGNLSSVSWSATSGGSAFTTYSVSGDKIVTINSSDVTIGQQIAFTASLTYLGNTYTNSITINSIAETIISSLSKGSVSISTASDGTGGDYTAATSTMTILIGSADDSANWTYSWSVPATVTATGGSTRTITVSAISVTTPVTLTCTATKAGYTTQTKDFVISKSIAGAAGLNAKLLTLDPTDWAFIFENSTATTATNPASITFTANKQNISGTTTFTATAYNSSNTSLGAVTLTGTGDTRTLTAANFNSLGATTVRYVKVSATADSITDNVTIWRGDNGSDALTFLLTNEAHVVPASSAGVVSSYTGALTYGAIFRGITNETSLWTITKSDGTGLTTTLTGTGTNNITLTATALADATDSAISTLTATRTGYPTLTKDFSISKSKTGAAGTPGTRIAVLELYQWASSTPTTFPSGTSTYTWSTGAFTNPATLNGWSQLASVGSGTAGQILYVTLATYSDTNTTSTSTVTWPSTGQTAIASGLNGNNGTNGTNGTRLATLELYRWASSTPTTFPSGTSTYTWSTGAFTDPATLNGWSQLASVGSGTAGQILYLVQQTYSDTSTSATSSVTWSSSTAVATGLNGTNGTNGTNGLRTATGQVYYSLTSASAPSPTPSATSYNFSTAAFTSLTTNWALGAPTFAAGNSNKYWYSTYTVVESSPGSGTGTPTFSSPVQAIGFSGLVTFTGSDSATDGTNTLSFGSTGTTTINGSRITTGSITSTNHSGTGDGSNFSTAGTKLNLNNGTISSPGLYLNSAGTVGVKGTFRSGDAGNRRVEINGVDIYGSVSSSNKLVVWTTTNEPIAALGGGQQGDERLFLNNTDAVGYLAWCVGKTPVIPISTAEATSAVSESNYGFQVSSSSGYNPRLFTYHGEWASRYTFRGPYGYSTRSGYFGTTSGQNYWQYGPGYDNSVDWTDGTKTYVGTGNQSTTWMPDSTNDNIKVWASRIISPNAAAIFGTGTNAIYITRGTFRYQNVTIDPPPNNYQYYLRGDGQWGQLITNIGANYVYNSSVNTNSLYLKWESDSNLSLTIDTTAFGASAASAWPIRLDASKLVTGTVPTARLGTGTANSTTYLRGDGTWAAVTGGGTGTVTSITAGTGLTGGTITTTGTIALATSGVTAATYSSGISSITVDTYGRITSITGSAGYVTSSGVTSIIAGTGLTGGTITSTGTIALATSGVTAATYSSGISSITVDTYGRITGITGGAGYLTSAVTSISGTSNQVTASASTGSVTLSLPQNIHTSATPQFTGLNLNGSQIGASALTILNNLNSAVTYRKTTTNCTGTIMPWDSSVFYAHNLHYNNGWVFTAPSGHTNSSIISQYGDTGSNGGVLWYFSTNSGASFNIANGVQLWNQAGNWTSKVNGSILFGISGLGNAGPVTWDNSASIIVSYNTIGAAAASHTHAASDITSGTMATARLGTGTADSTTFLRGDGTWATPTVTNSTLTLNTSGTGLSGSTTYNGSSAVTFTVTSNATNANTASTIVARDASGNFSAGTITANTSGTHTGTSSQVDVTNTAAGGTNYPLMFVSGTGTGQTARAHTDIGWDGTYLRIQGNSQSNSAKMGYSTDQVYGLFYGNHSAAGGGAIMGGGITTGASTNVTVIYNGQFRPFSNNTMTCGLSGQAWSVVWTYSTQSPSDQRRKEDQRSLNDKELAVAQRLKQLIKVFRFKDRSILKYNNVVKDENDLTIYQSDPVYDNRFRVGVIAQEVIAAFNQENLDWQEYSIVSEDPETGYYGVNYNDLYAFIIATL